MQLYILKQWSELSGNALKAIVASSLHQHNDVQRYVMAVLDPAVTYGIKGNLKFGYGTEPFGFLAYDLLDRLARRELTGNAAKDALKDFCGVHNEEAVELMNRALNKDMRCGVGATLINDLSMHTGFKIPVFGVALCKDAEEKRLAKGEWVAATKYDGIRALIEVRDNKVQFFTRSGKLIPALASLEKDVLDVFGGRRVMLDSEGVSKSFLDSVSSLRKHAATTDESVVLQTFDILDLEEFYAHDGRKEPFGAPLRQRLEFLEDIMLGANVDRVRLVKHAELTGYHHESKWHHAMALAEAAWDRGDEGMILRLASAQYTKARTFDWLKIKADATFDAVIEGYYEGEGQFAGMLGGVTVTIDGVQSRVGGGWSKIERKEAWEDPSLIMGRIIEIKCNERMPSGALRHARKKRFRDFDGAKA